MFLDPMYFVFMIPAFILSLWAQSKVKGNFRKYSQVPVSTGMTGAEAARRVLNDNGLSEVPIQRTKGMLSDHYDPRKRALFLSDAVYDQRSVAAVAVAAHEAGHAIQHATSYQPLKWRTAIVPAVNVGSQLGFIVLIAGIMMGLTGLAWAGVALFALSTIFALITLPVEFDASKRAKVALVHAGVVDGGVTGGAEGKGVDAVLDAAAWTYIAGFIASLLSLLYWISLVSGQSRD